MFPIKYDIKIPILCVRLAEQFSDALHPTQENYMKIIVNGLYENPNLIFLKKLTAEVSNHVVNMAN